jgi:hypothetical protein
MSKKILPLIGLVLLSGSVAAQVVLYENPYDPQGIGGGGLSPDPNYASATAITLTNLSTIQAFSFTVEDLRAQPESVYTWSVYTDVNGMPSGPPGPISGPTGAPTYLPIVSGQAGINSFQNAPTVFSWYTVVPAINNLNSINEVTIDTGPITLGAGNYFLALSSEGPETSAESWLSGAYNTGDVSSFAGAFTPANAGGDAIIVVGTSVPEIDPSSAVGGLTLLLGGLMVLRGRRAVKLDSAAA